MSASQRELGRQRRSVRDQFTAQKQAERRVAEQTSVRRSDVQTRELGRGPSVREDVAEQRLRERAAERAGDDFDASEFDVRKVGGRLRAEPVDEAVKDQLFEDLQAKTGETISRDDVYFEQGGVTFEAASGLVLGGMIGPDEKPPSQEELRQRAAEEAGPRVDPENITVRFEGDPDYMGGITTPDLHTSYAAFVNEETRQELTDVTGARLSEEFKRDRAFESIQEATDRDLTHSDVRFDPVGGTDPATSGISARVTEASQRQRIRSEVAAQSPVVDEDEVNVDLAGDEAQIDIRGEKQPTEPVGGFDPEPFRVSTAGFSAEAAQQVLRTHRETLAEAPQAFRPGTDVEDIRSGEVSPEEVGKIATNLGVLGKERFGRAEYQRIDTTEEAVDVFRQSRNRLGSLAFNQEFGAQGAENPDIFDVTTEAARKQAAREQALEAAPEGIEAKDIDVDVEDGRVSAAVSDRAIEDVRQQRRRDLRQQVAEQAGEGIKPRDVDVQEQDGQLTGRVEIDALQRQVAEEAGPEYAPQDVTVQSGEQGTRAFISEAAVSREQQELKREVAVEAGQRVGPSDIVVRETDEGRRLSVKEEVARDVAAERAIAETARQVEGVGREDLSPEDVTFVEQDGQRVAKVSERKLREELPGVHVRAAAANRDRVLPTSGTIEQSRTRRSMIDRGGPGVGLKAAGGPVDDPEVGGKAFGIKQLRALPRSERIDITNRLTQSGGGRTEAQEQERKEAIRSIQEDFDVGDEAESVAKSLGAPEPVQNVARGVGKGVGGVASTPLAGLQLIQTGTETVENFPRVASEEGVGRTTVAAVQGVGKTLVNLSEHAQSNPGEFIGEIGIGVAAGSVAGKAVQAAPSRVRGVSIRARGGKIKDFEALSDPPKKTMGGELPAFSREAVKDRAVAVKEFVEQAEATDIAGDRAVAFHGRGAEAVSKYGGFGRQFTVPGGSSELPGFFQSADLSGLRLPGSTQSSLSIPRPDLPRPNVRSSRVLAEVDVDVGKAAAQTRQQTKQFLEETASREKSYIRGDITPEQEAIAPPGSKFVNEGGVFGVRVGGRRIPGTDRRIGGEIVPGRLVRRAEADDADSPPRSDIDADTAGDDVLTQREVATETTQAIRRSRRRQRSAREPFLPVSPFSGSFESSRGEPTSSDALYRPTEPTRSQQSSGFNSDTSPTTSARRSSSIARREESPVSTTPTDPTEPLQSSSPTKTTPPSSQIASSPGPSTATTTSPISPTSQPSSTPTLPTTPVGTPTSTPTAPPTAPPTTPPAPPKRGRQRRSAPEDATVDVESGFTKEFGGGVAAEEVVLEGEVEDLGDPESFSQPFEEHLSETDLEVTDVEGNVDDLM